MTPRALPASLSKESKRNPASGRLLFCILFCATSAGAQPVIAPSAPATLLPTAPRGFPGSSPTARATAGPGTSPAPQGPSPFPLGDVDVRPHLTYRFVYGDGIQSRPGNQVTTAVHEISPGLLFELGDRWTLDYTAMQSLYAQRELSDTVGHTANLQGTKSAGDWGLQFGQNYSLSSTPMIETARQTKQENVGTNLGALRPFGGKFALEMSATQSLRFAGAIGDAFEWSNTNWLIYRPIADFSAGLGAGAGYVDISNAPNQTTQRYRGRIGWQVSRKVGLDLDGGVEIRDTKAKGGAATKTPVYSAALRYQPFDHTTLSFLAGRSASVSLFQNQVSDSRNWGASLNQRLLGKLNLTVNFARQQVGYEAPVTTGAVNRADATKSLSLRLGTTILRRGTIAVFYQRNQNTSNIAGFGFTSSQVGAESGYKY